MDDYPQVAASYGSAINYQSGDDIGDVRKGPWTVEEDAILSDYVSVHGEGRWNAAARCAGLKRTGKSCRLRWLNYLRPNVRRGNITLEEQLLILELHSRWGNRWSKIAQYLPGRTDNEIKNYWRTRVQKQAKQLKCDVNSKQFRDAMRYIWMPRLVERIQAASMGQPTNHTPANAINMMPADPSVTTSTSSDSFSFNTQTLEDQNPCRQEDTEKGSGWNEENEWSWCGGAIVENLWNEENVWFLQQQLM